MSYILLYEFIGKLGIPNWTPENKLKYFLNIIELQDHSMLQFVLGLHFVCVLIDLHDCVLLKDRNTAKIF